MEPVVLAEVTRGSGVESTHRGWVAISNSKGELIGGTHQEFPGVFWRSSLKVVQVLPLLMHPDFESLNLSDQDITVLMSSHSGEDIHTGTVERLLKKHGFKEDQLLCGTHQPYSMEIANQLIKEGKVPSILHCNCSGKHIGMLSSCLLNGWSTEKYDQYDHPLQVEIRKYIKELTGIEAEIHPWGIDGCGVPTYSLPLEGLATIFAKIADPENITNSDLKKALQIIKRSIPKNPVAIGGIERIDTRIGQIYQGNVFSKIGGEAVLGVAIPDRKIGLAIKIADGNKRPLEVILHYILNKINLDFAKSTEVNEKVDKYVLNNLKIKVGKIASKFDLRC